MYALKLIVKNSLRHKLRTSLTILGLVVAVLAFGLMQTVIGAWYAGSEAASATTLVTRNSTSLVFSLPISYGAKLRQVEGVSAVAYANWFGGIYQDPKNFFPQFAISGQSYLDLYPDYLIPDAQRKDFLRDRKGAIVGRKLAEQYGFKIGDTIPLRGTIFPGNWSFTVRAIYDGRKEITNTSQMFVHFDYINEVLQRTIPRRANQIGAFFLKIDDADQAAQVAGSVDRSFKNSLAETLTETEKAFQLSFVAMSDAIIAAVKIVSYVVILIIMAVTANTMAMSARERLAEYATLKALGFGPGFLVQLIVGESLLLALVGGGLGIALLFPSAAAFAAKLGTLFPTFEISSDTVVLQMLSALAVGVVAAIAPTIRALRVNIVEGLRHIG